MKSSKLLSTLLPKVLRRHRIIDSIVRLLPQERIQQFPFNDSEAVGDLSFPDARQVFIRGEFADYGYFDLAEALLPVDGVHFDVGANFGFQTFGLCKRLAHLKCRYHLFEPNRFCIECHQLSIRLFPESSFFINDTALGRSEGHARLSFKSSHVGGGFVQPLDAEALLQGMLMQTVRIMTLDAYMRGCGVRQVDLCKVDIEGAEPDFIAGAAETLMSGNVKAIYMEINPEALTRSNNTPQDVYTSLRGLGFHLVYPHRKSKGTWATYQTSSGFIELSDFEDDFVCGQFDILGLHDSSGIWKSRVGKSTIKASLEFDPK